MSLFCLNSQSNAQQKKDNAEAKILVAYFSCTGNTESVAKSISKATGGTLYRITPKKAYSSADLDWRDKNSRSSIEMNDENSRPELSGEAIDMNDYDTVLIGYPIWWDLAPRVINTFIESYNLEGKVLIPFATSGGSSIDNSVASLKKEYPTLQWKNGRLLNRTNRNIIKEWIEKL